MDIHFLDKIKLYCKLHGNHLSSLKKPELINDQCEKCRSKNDGICNIRYRKYYIIYNEKTDNILELITYNNMDKTEMWSDFDDKILKWKLEIDPTYTQPQLFSCTPIRLTSVCFGNLYNENNDK